VSKVISDAAHSTSGTTSRSISTVYNAAGEITAISDPDAAIAYTRDNLGRATTITNTIAGLAPTIAFSQSFDAANNRTGLSATVGGTADFANTYQYDSLQRLTDLVQQSQSGGNAVTAKHLSMAYNTLGQSTTISRYQSAATSNPVATSTSTYDTANRLKSLTHAQASTTLAGYAYTYDGLSRPTSIDSFVDGVTDYSYDVAGQLTGADHASQADEAYGFDANGNRNTTDYTTSGNKQTSESPGFTYTYDDEGNRLTRTSTTTGEIEHYTWDHRNRLVQVLTTNEYDETIEVVEYAYDAFQRLVRRTADPDGDGSSSATTQFWAYDDGINALVEYDGPTASDLSHRYLWSNAVDQLFADEQVTSLSSGGNVIWPLGDHLGTLRDIADLNESTGVTAVTNHRQYSSFGKLVAETDTSVDLIFNFTGKQYDEQTQLQHNVNRWLDSELGRWVSNDPIGFEARDANLSRYVGNHFTTKIDPLGLFDIYGGGDLDVVPIIGLEVNVGYVLDTDDLGSSGFYFGIGPAIGVNFGAGFTGGITSGDIEEGTLNVDMNAAPIGVTGTVSIPHGQRTL
jgi:RHS repeat-associated protein